MDKEEYERAICTQELMDKLAGFKGNHFVIGLTWEAAEKFTIEDKEDCRKVYDEDGSEIATWDKHSRIFYSKEDAQEALRGEELSEYMEVRRAFHWQEQEVKFRVKPTVYIYRCRGHIFVATLDHLFEVEKYDLPEWEMSKFFARLENEELRNKNNVSAAIFDVDEMEKAIDKAKEFSEKREVKGVEILYYNYIDPEDDEEFIKNSDVHYTILDKE